MKNQHAQIELAVLLGIYIALWRRYFIDIILVTLMIGAIYDENDRTGCDDDPVPHA